MPGGWLLVAMRLLCAGVSFITFGPLPTLGTIGFSVFVWVASQQKTAKVTLGKGSNALVADLKSMDDLKNAELKERVSKQARNGKVEVRLWNGDVASGKVSDLLTKYD